MIRCVFLYEKQYIWYFTGNHNGAIMTAVTYNAIWEKIQRTFCCIADCMPTALLCANGELDVPLLYEDNQAEVSKLTANTATMHNLYANCQTTQASP